jgi:hypothetical protein
MYRYEVGKLYHPERTRWEERGEYSYRANSHELRMFFSRLTPQDVRAIRNGKCTFAVAPIEDIVFFCYEFGRACPWSDAPYTIHAVKPEERTLPPELSASSRAPLSIILVAAETGIIQALRQISLGHDFSMALHTAIREQAMRPFKPASYDRQLEQAYKQYPTTSDLLKRSVATCVVGDNLN